MKVLLCSLNTFIMFIFRWVVVRYCLWVSMYGRTSCVLFNIYRCACETSYQLIVTAWYPYVPLPARVRSWWVRGSPIGLTISMYSEQKYILQQRTFQQWNLLVGIYSLYNLLRPSCTTQLDTSIIKKWDHTT